MNQQEHSSQLSALFDNELSPEQAELVIRRALKDPAMRTTWGRYALIGACVRGEPLAGRLRPESDVAARVRIRLAVESSPCARRRTLRAATRHPARCGTAGARRTGHGDRGQRCRGVAVSSSGPGATGRRHGRADALAAGRCPACRRRLQQRRSHSRRRRRPVVARPALRPATRPRSTIRRWASGWMRRWSITWSRTARSPLRRCVSVRCPR